ncbi:hypothetical protein ACN47E_002810 [Coniothyrium glycines]
MATLAPQRGRSGHDDGGDGRPPRKPTDPRRGHYDEGVPDINILQALQDAGTAPFHKYCLYCGKDAVLQHRRDWRNCHKRGGKCLIGGDECNHNGRLCPRVLQVANADWCWKHTHDEMVTERAQAREIHPSRSTRRRERRRQADDVDMREASPETHDRSGRQYRDRQDRGRGQTPAEILRAMNEASYRRPPARNAAPVQQSAGQPASAMAELDALLEQMEQMRRQYRQEIEQLAARRRQEDEQLAARHHQLIAPLQQQFAAAVHQNVASTQPSREPSPARSGRNSFLTGVDLEARQGNGTMWLGGNGMLGSTYATQEARQVHGLETAETARSAPPPMQGPPATTEAAVEDAQQAHLPETPGSGCFENADLEDATMVDTDSSNQGPGLPLRQKEDGA